MGFFEVVGPVTAGVVGIIVAALQAALASRGERRQPRAAEQTLEDRLTDLGDLMRSSSRVLEEVQAEIQARLALAEKAKKDADEAQQVAQLNEAQRLAVARLVRAELAGEVSKSSKRTFWQGFAVNFFFFAAGVVASVVTAVLLDS
ncbi:hypothetical protein [Micromonospora sp. DT47]|uniref:hypothetical protein n=1 Tax=Micromonospora sp. DT47 TaxID=3393431 RepID=UPI003CF04A3F